ncbi:MAG: protein kinase [Myxococcales bacterium]|nr:protein kinase [Myxococcales bacterium]
MGAIPFGREGARVLVCTICGAKWRGEPTVCPLDGGSLDTLPDPLIGRTIAGRYVITERVGAGGMGTVYKARHEIVGRDVAIKFLAPDLAGDKTNRERFLREAKAANRIDHEHIIDITDYGETRDGLAYLVMEFLIGQPLSRLIERGPLAAHRAVDIARQMASALARAHELDVIHRDIKPDNVYVIDRGTGMDFVKLLDFGLAKMKGEMRLTASGAVFGTPEYMAPEQARGRPLTGKADLYALGCVLHEMLTGHPPFDGATPDLILRHIREVPAAVSSIVEGLPTELDALVLRLLEKDPERRHADAHHLSEELRQVAQLLPRPSAFPPSTQQRVAEAMSATLRTIDDRPTWTSAAERWEEKVLRFRQLANRAHGGRTPAWLESAFVELEGWLRELQLRRAELDRSASMVMQQEEEIRNVRLQIGKAIDVLVSDESRAIRELEEIDTAIRDLAETHAARDRELRAAWQQLPPMPAANVALDPRAVAMLHRAGEAATRWSAVDGRFRELHGQKAQREGSRNDLRFQVAQLKERLASLNAEGETDLASLREKTMSLDVAVQDLMDKIAVRSEEIVKHLLEFEELRDAVRAAGA